MVSGRRAPSSRQVRAALETIARSFGPGWEVGPMVLAHVEYPAHRGGPVDTFRVYAVCGDRDVFIGQVPRASLNGEGGVG